MKATRYYRANDGTRLEILSDHIRTGGGNFNGVCVSACLSYLGILPNEYKYTWSKRTRNNVVSGIMRRFGYCVRSRKSAFKKCSTMGKLKKSIAKYNDVQDNVLYYVHVTGHVLLLDKNGKVLVDTSPRKNDRRKVWDVKAVFK